MAKTDMKTLLARKDEVLASIQNYTNDNCRPCPTDHLEAEFGDITKLLQILKMTEEVTGLRGRVGGLVLTDDVDSLKERMNEAKKAAKKPKKAKAVKAAKAPKSKKSKAKVETVQPDEDDEDVEIEDEDDDSADVASVITDAEPVEADEDIENLISDINDIVEGNAFSES